jgi:hypothetical protein
MKRLWKDDLVNAIVMTFWTQIFIWDYLLAGQVLGQPSLWWMHRAMDYWYWSFK